MIKDGMQRAGRLIKEGTANELKGQGHHLTGALEQSINASAEKISGGWQLQVTALDYQKYLHWGVMPAKASFKQFPFVVRYFQQRGLDENEAKRAAAATIRIWMKTGMPTPGSYVHSRTGARLQFLDDVDKKVWPAAGQAISAAIDDEINRKFHQTKSETI